MVSSGRYLAEVLRGVRAGELPGSAVDAAFLSATVYARRPGQVGALAAEVPGHGRCVPVFSSLEGLGRFSGECDWFGLTGADLLWQLPPKIAVVIDPLDEHCIVIHPHG